MQKIGLLHNSIPFIRPEDCIESVCTFLMLNTAKAALTHTEHQGVHQDSASQANVSKLIFQRANVWRLN